MIFLSIDYNSLLFDAIMAMKGYSIFFARIIYAISWFYLAPAIPYIIFTFKVPLNLAGVIPFSFFLGSGSMQIPSAFISSKLGSRNTLVLGLFIMSLSAFLIGVSRVFYQILVFYFIAGVGASMFFSTGAAILAYLNETKVSTALGVYNSMFALGGIIGLNWIILDEKLGFSISSVILSILTILAAIVNINKPNLKMNWKIIKDKNSFIIGVASAGVWGIYYVVGELFPSFAKFYLGIQILQSTEFTSILLLSSMLGGLLGFLGDRMDKIKLLIISSLLGSIPALLLYTKYYILGIIIIGLFNELSISIVYAVASIGKGINSGISLAEVNSLNILIGSLFEPIGSLVGNMIWAVTTILSIIPLILLKKLKVNV